jgi:CheY-like chemotaxis protein
VRVLIAEDEPDISTTYKTALELRDHEVVISRDGEQCLEIYKAELERKKTHDSRNFPAESTSSLPSSSSPFDVLILDHRMPRKDGMEVAKEVLYLNPQQRIIFASAYVKETLEDSIKQLKQVVELLQKPFDISVLVNTIEDVEARKGLMKIMKEVRQIKEDENPTTEQLRDIFEGLRKLQKGRISWI